MNIIHTFSILVLGLVLYINQAFSKTQAVYEINVIPIDKNIFEAGVNNQIRISLWSKTRNYPVSMEEIEPVDDSLIDVIIFSKDLRAFSQFHMEDFPHYNNETNLPTTANYFDIDYVFPIAGEYTISIKCKPYKRNVRVNQVIHVEGKKDSKMDVDNTILPADPNVQKIVYFKPIQLENVKSIYRLPIIPHTLAIPEKELKNELSKATGPIYGTKISIKNTLRNGYCSNVILEFFRVELKKDKIEEIPVQDLFQYSNVPIKAVLGNQENPDFDIIQGNILNAVSDKFPSCGSKIDPPTEMVYGPIFGFSVPFRQFGLYNIIFEVAHSYNENTYLLAPSIALRVAEENVDIKYAPEDYMDDDTNYDQFIKDVIDGQSSIPDGSNEGDKEEGEGQKEGEAENKEEGEEEKEKEEGDGDGDDKEAEANKEEGEENKEEEKEKEEGDDKEAEANKEGEENKEENKEEEKEEEKGDEKGDEKEAEAEAGSKTTTTTTAAPTTTKSEVEPIEKPVEETFDDKKPAVETSTEKPSEPTPLDPDDQEIEESTHGKIIIIGVAGIITVSGLMFYKQKSNYANIETIPSEYKQINPGNDDDDDEDFMLNTEEKEMLEKRLEIGEDDLLDNEDYTLMENDE
eukprot:jgi/Orpsp1_1/1181627/evm.model.c7180000077990.1